MKPKPNLLFTTNLMLINIKLYTKQYKNKKIVNMTIEIEIKGEVRKKIKKKEIKLKF